MFVDGNVVVAEIHRVENNDDVVENGDDINVENGHDDVGHDNNVENGHDDVGHDNNIENGHDDVGHDDDVRHDDVMPNEDRRETHL